MLTIFGACFSCPKQASGVQRVFFQPSPMLGVSMDWIKFIQFRFLCKMIFEVMSYRYTNMYQRTSDRRVSLAPVIEIVLNSCKYINPRVKTVEHRSNHMKTVQSTDSLRLGIYGWFLKSVFSGTVHRISVLFEKSFYSYLLIWLMNTFLATVMSF